MSTVWIVAVLRAWGAPMSSMSARVAVLMCRRAAGLDVPHDPDDDWGRAVRGMRARGDLIEVGAGGDETWALGPGAAAIDTAGWPDDHAARAVARLRRQGVELILAGAA